MKDPEKTMTVAEAAQRMGTTEQFIRQGLKQNRLPFGYAVQTSAKRWTFWIDRKKFEEVVG